MKSFLRQSFVLNLVFGSIWCAMAASAASAQTLCDLLPASAVQAALGIKDTLTAKVNTDGGQGCDYSTSAPGPLLAMLDVGDDKGVVKMVFDQRLKNLGPSDQRVPNLGDVAIYRPRLREQLPKYLPLIFTQQNLAIRAKGKYISLIIWLPGDGAPKATILALGSLLLSKPIEKLKDPQ